jgi:hypothetical protein
MGANDILFTWDGTLKTAVAVSGQVSNASISSYGAGCFTGTGGTKWVAHDVSVYGPGTYTVFASCLAKSPGCSTGTNPITFTVGTNEIGVHMLVDWGTISTNKNIDVVNVWQQKAVFGPSPMWTAACGLGNSSQTWDLMSKPNPATSTINGYAMVDGQFTGTRWNFNMMGAPINRVVDTGNNNFTMIDGTGATFGGTNDVRFTWDGTRKTSVAVSGQISNASLSSPCNFFTRTWAVHDMAVYGPGTYTIYDACPAGSPGCGAGNPITFTVNPGEMGGHMLFYWNRSDDIDVVDVWQPNTVFGPSVMNDNTTAGFVYGCGTNSLSTVWDHMSYDWDGDGINGAPMTSGLFAGSSANFNVIIGDTCLKLGLNCDDDNACTADSCDPATGCVHTPISCDDGNVCTTDSCDPATGCVHTPISCDAGDVCTADSCDPASGCVHTPIPGCVVCDPSSPTTFILMGGGQNPNTVDEQIQTMFSVLNHSGCILSSTKSSITVSVGTILQYSVTAGVGPQPSICTFAGAAVPCGTNQIPLTTAGTAGKLVLITRPPEAVIPTE